MPLIKQRRNFNDYYKNKSWEYWFKLKRFLLKKCIKILYILIGVVIPIKKVCIKENSAASVHLLSSHILCGNNFQNSSAPTGFSLGAHLKML